MPSAATNELFPAHLSRVMPDVLARRVENEFTRIEECDLYTHYCHVNRRMTIKGAVCRTDERTVVNSFSALQLARPAATRPTRAVTQAGIALRIAHE